jgi:hypothetical protein
MMRRQSLLQTPTQQLRQMNQAASAGIVVPRPSTPQGGRRRYVISMPLVQIIHDDEGFYDDLTASFLVDNPSVRLQLKVAVLYQANVPSDLVPTGASIPLLSLQAYDRDQDGRIFPSNQIIGALPVPTSYEALTMNDRWRGVVTIPSQDDITLDPGFLFAVAAWEPAPGWNGDDDQLAKIFDACHLYIEHGLTAFV